MYIYLYKLVYYLSAGCTFNFTTLNFTGFLIVSKNMMPTGTTNINMVAWAEQNRF